MKKVAVHNLGCKVNGYELDMMVQALRAQGFMLVPFTERADVYVVNTCTVTNIADRKSRQMLHKAKHENPSAVVVAVGCYVETDKQRIMADPCVDLAIENNRKSQLASILTDYLAAREASPDQPCSTPQTSLDQSSSAPQASPAHPRPALLTTPGHTRAYIKIQDGCNQFCTYCIIPYARGRICSRDTEEIVEEIKGLAAEGVKEVVLTGIHISSFGKDRGEEPGGALLALLTRIQLIAGIRRIRLGSLEPRIMTEEFVSRMAKLSKVCPHFHLSLQSGCDATLRRMNRHYTTEEYFRSVELLRRYYDRPAITTDVIVGFAGETPEEFAQSKAFLEKVNFYEIHVFKYSVRHGTAAAKMPLQQTPQTKAARSDILLELTKQQAQQYRESFLGQEEEILLEEPVTIEGTRYWTGHTMRYVLGAIPESALAAEPAETSQATPTVQPGDACQAIPAVQPDGTSQDAPLVFSGYEGRLVRGTFTRMLPGTPYLEMQLIPRTNEPAHL